MIDYSALLYDPVYAEIGVEATFTTSLLAVALTVIDDTRPKVMAAGSAEVRSVGPGAFVRIPELERSTAGPGSCGPMSCAAVRTARILARCGFC